MARAQWSKTDIPAFAKIGAIFVAAGTLLGFFRGDGILIGGFAGVLLFGMVVGVGSLIELINRSS